MKKLRIEIKWAVLFVLATLVWMVLERSLGFHDKNIDKHAIFTNFFMVVAAVIYVFALMDKRRNYYNNAMTWKQGFISGVIIGIFVGILTPVSQLITSYVISPDYYNNAMTWKQGFISGVIIGIFVGILTPVSQLITSYVISPDYFDNAIQYTVESGQYTMQEAKDYFNIKNYIITSTIFAPLAGIVTAAIVAIFVRRK